MQVWGLTEEQIRDTVIEVGKRYAYNIAITDRGIRKDGRSYRFTLRVLDSKGAGASVSASGRRSVAADWYVHRDVMLAIFGINEDARIKTVLADYRGVSDFEFKHQATRYGNASGWRYA